MTRSIFSVLIAVASLGLVTACAQRIPLAPNPTIGVALAPPSPAGSQPWASTGAVPEAPQGVPLDLAAVIHEAARGNPRLAAARRRWLAAKQRGTVARSLPDPMLTYTEMLEPIQTRVGPLDRSVQLSQTIPFPGRLSAAGAVADEQARVKELEYHIALRDTIAEIKVTYAELVYLHGAIAIVEQNQQLATQLAQKAATAYAGQGQPGEDTVSLFDTLKAQSSLAQLAYDKITLTELLAAEEAKLNALLSRTPARAVGRPHALRFRVLSATRADLFGIATARRQEIQAAIHKVRAARHGERLARLSQVPNFTLGVQYSFIGNAAGPVSGSGDDAVGLRLGFSLPIWGDKNRARILQARHRAQAARLEQRAVTDDVMARISKIYFRLQNAGRLVQLYDGSLIPQAEQAMRIAEQWHDTGRDTYGRLLESRMVWLNFQLASARALVDYEQMVARLEQLVGISLHHLRTGEVTK